MKKSRRQRLPARRLIRGIVTLVRLVVDARNQQQVAQPIAECKRVRGRQRLVWRPPLLGQHVLLTHARYRLTARVPQRARECRHVAFRAGRAVKRYVADRGREPVQAKHATGLDHQVFHGYIFVAVVFIRAILRLRMHVGLCRAECFDEFIRFHFFLPY